MRKKGKSAHGAPGPESGRRGRRHRRSAARDLKKLTRMEEKTKRGLSPMTLKEYLEEKLNDYSNLHNFNRLDNVTHWRIVGRCDMLQDLLDRVEADSLDCEIKVRLTEGY